MNIIFGNMNIQSLIAGVIASLAAVFILLPFHEYSHARVAVWLGDNSPKYYGRLTLNPFAHIDFLGAAMLIFFGFGWAKPVGINERNFKNPKRDMALTALAGPVSNILLALIFNVLGNALIIFFSSSSVVQIIYFIFYWFSYISVSLAVFNFIPIPPLDGSRLLTAFLPDRVYYRLMQYERYFSFAIILLILLINRTGIFDFIVSGVMRGVMYVASLPFLPFL